MPNSLEELLRMHVLNHKPWPSVYIVMCQQLPELLATSGSNPWVSQCDCVGWAG